MRTIPPLVTTKWLAENMAEPGLVVTDIRNSDEYKAGHIPGAVNAPFSSWAKARGGLLLELPEADELFDTIGAAGINPLYPGRCRQSGLHADIRGGRKRGRSQRGL
jgi:3-mercaptopyruvate sulfurtransferase SseA